MSEYTPLIKALTDLGVAGIVALMWFFTFRAMNDNVKNTIAMQQEQSANILKTMDKFDAAMDKLGETMSYLSAILTRMEEKIETNRFCPVVREGSKK